MAIVFNRPVLPDGTSKFFAGQVVTQNVITHIFSDFVAFLLHTDDHADGLHRRPVIEHLFAAWNRCHIVVTITLTAACLFARVVTMATSFRPVSIFPMVIEKRLDRFKQSRLIAFDSNHEFPFL